MNLDYSELERGFAEEMQKAGGWDGFWKPFNTQGDSKVLNTIKGGYNLATLGPRAVFNAGSAAIQALPTLAKGTVAAGEMAASAPQNITNAAKGAYSIYKGIPKVMDNIGKFAPLAMGAMMLPSLMGKGQGQQGGGGQPVVVNNYMGQKPNMLTPQQGVHSLSSPKVAQILEKRSDVITKALSDAAKRRMANKVLDVVTPEQETEEKRSPEELEVVTKYPELAKMLEDEQNKAYLGRLLQH